MMHVMRYLILWLGLLFTSLAGAQTPLADFAELMQELRAGRTVQLVADYSKTRAPGETSTNAELDAVGGMKLEAWEYFGRGVVRNERAYVASSKTVLIEHPSRGFVYNYVRFRIFEDGEVEITARYLEPLTFQAVMESTYLGSLGLEDEDAVRAFSVAPDAPTP